MIALSVFSLAVMAAPDLAPAVNNPETCPVIDTERLTARTWSDFEFSTEIEGSPMWLADRGCYVRAAEASRQYLARGPLLSVREQAISQLHMGRYLAFAGDEKAAAQAVASARRSDQRGEGEIALDWNAYVEGVYGFLVKDRALLESRLDRLRRSPNRGDAFNARNLSWLSNCFERSYMEAQTDPTCTAEPSAP